MKVPSKSRYCVENDQKSTVEHTIDKISRIVNQEKSTGHSKRLALLLTADRDANDRIRIEAYPDTVG